MLIVIRQIYARLLTGGSTGGWEAMALQVLHPDFFGGTWVLFPDHDLHTGMVKRREPLEQKQK